MTKFKLDTYVPDHRRRNNGVEDDSRYGFRDSVDFLEVTKLKFKRYVLDHRRRNNGVEDDSPYGIRDSYYQ